MTAERRRSRPAGRAARLTGLHARYAAVHSFPLVEPESGRSIGTASWGNAILTRAPLADGFALGLPRRRRRPGRAGAAADRPLAGVRYGDTEPGHREPRCVVGGPSVRTRRGRSRRPPDVHRPGPAPGPGRGARGRRRRPRRRRSS